MIKITLLYKVLFFALLFILSMHNAFCQFLSHLSADENFPVFTTYAAPMERTNYKTDQAYEMMWYHPEKPVQFESKKGGIIGFTIADENGRIKTLETFYQKPVISATYSDLVTYSYAPEKYIEINESFNVYSSETAVRRIQISNTSVHHKSFSLLAYFYFPGKTIKDVEVIDNSAFCFVHEFQKDGWMKNHKIPMVENLFNYFDFYENQMEEIEREAINKNHHTFYAKDYRSFTDSLEGRSKGNGRTAETSKINALVIEIPVKLKAKGSLSFSLVRSVFAPEIKMEARQAFIKEACNASIEKLIAENEKLYAGIPKLPFTNKKHEALYWNAFTLIRQCMMPPEGECSYNYYIFSREPKWGWGYGGQVFHESLTMFAYAYMDPEGAMNSQRVYIERQWDNGYINYRTGPYLNEQIEREGEYTSSAPWFNYQNFEIYKITRNKLFLKEAYDSGKRFYEYYTQNRDKDNDGLCEWGAHAVLECVRDARVAIWDEVAWPANFEGPDVNAMLVMEAKALSEMATLLGNKKEAKQFKKDAEKRAKLIRENLWDEESDFFYNIQKETHEFTYKEKNDLKRKEIIGFLPLWAGVTDEEQTKSLIEHLTNTNEFWRPYGVPTLSASDPYYNPIGYWNGPVWVQWDYFIFKALLDNGYEKEAKELAYRVADQMIYFLEYDHVFWEFYSPDDRHAGWNKTYIWAGIIARFFIDLHEQGLLE